MLRRLEEILAGGCLLAAVLLPLSGMLARGMRAAGLDGALANLLGAVGAAPLVQHLTLWIAFLGAGLAAREGKLLSLATGEFLPDGALRRAARVFSSTVAAAVSSLLAGACLMLVETERQWGEESVVPGLPVWWAQLVLPISFWLVGGRIAWRAGDTFFPRALAAAGWTGGLALAWSHTAGFDVEAFDAVGLLDGRPVWPGLVLVGLATLLGAPLFVALGGAAVLLFMAEGVPIAAVPAETYRLSVSPFLPAIPLFTLAGFFLAEGKASGRLLAVFRAWVGWVPGGTAVVCALLCTFLTVFTGGSGVTILAAGALLHRALRDDGYRESFSLGLLTASGSLGLLLPPALPLILYGIVAEIPIENLFIGGLLPSALLILLVAGWGVREGLVTGAGRVPFTLKEALRATWGARFELAIPLGVLGLFFGGLATLVEISALTAVYTLVVQALIHRDIHLRRDLPRVLRECLVVLGGVLLILGVAMGLTNWMVDAEIPRHFLEAVKDTIESKIVFLLCLNVFLLLVGCLMDIFSATVVVVPLIVPLGLAFGVDPIHLGILFVANLELGYLTPPVGLNLFLASYRFEKPLLVIYRATLPMLAIRVVGVLLITFIPSLSTWLVGILGDP